MSLTIFVPADVPSVVHSSRPAAAVSALKNSFPPATVNPSGAEPAEPEAMFLTIFVPADVPSDFQSSRPCVASWASK